MRIDIGRVGLHQPYSPAPGAFCFRETVNLAIGEPAERLTAAGAPKPDQQGYPETQKKNCQNPEIDIQYPADARRPLQSGEKQQQEIHKSDNRQRQ